jgi:penicillin-binding protein 1C
MSNYWKNKNVRRIGISLLILLIIILAVPLPNPLFEKNYSTILTSSDGELLSASIASDEQWRFPPSDSIPQKFEVAIRLFEDEYFRYHPGINPVSLTRAISQNISAGKVVSGGSTIPMQTVRMAYGNQKRNYVQKAIEIIATLKLELFYSKESILKTYADHAPFGGNIVGINAAAWRYYGRFPHQLSWSESATLAILPNSPASIFPGKNDQVLIQKRNFLLDKIHAKGFISTDDLFLAKEEPLPSKIKPLPNDAYHLLHRRMAEDGGNKIITTLNGQIQRRANDIVQKYSEEMASNQIQNAAALIIEIESGNTLAYVGNTNNKGNHGQHVDIITARRSPGSLLKPILYAASLDEGLITPNQLLPDIPLFYKGFAPKNFDKKYRGAIPANEALISSLNVPFVHLLIEYGYEKFHQKLVDMGFNSFDQPAGHYGLSLILGGAETSLWEIANVYAGMARASNNFMKRPINKGYSSNDYRSNRYLFSAEQKNDPLREDGFIRIPSIDYAFKVMQEVKRPEEESGWEFFGSARPISWKTGTSYGFRDGWAVGLNGKYLIAVWVGNADGEGRAGLTGIRAAAPLLFELFDLVQGDTETMEPMGQSYSVCSESGMLLSERCISSVQMSLPEYMTQNKKCTFHQTLHLNKEESHQVNSSCYGIADMIEKSWFVLPPVQSWYYKKYHPNYKKLPTYLSKCLETEDDKFFQLIYPSKQTKVFIPLEQDGSKGMAIFEAAHEDQDSQLHWHLDNLFLGTTQGQHQMGINTTKGAHLLTILDEQGNELTRKFEVIN